MLMSGEFYLVHTFGGLRWMKMGAEAGSVEADQT